MNNNEFGMRLKELRAEKATRQGRRKITQEEVAKQLQISPGAYGSWESGRTSPRIDLLPKIADYFKISIDDLLGHSVDIQVKGNLNNAAKAPRWKLRRRAETEDEKKGIKVWRRLAGGENPETIMDILKIHSVREIDRYLQNVIYTDLISIDDLPYDNNLAEQVQQTFGLRKVVTVSVPKESPLLYRNALLGEAARSYFKDRVFEGMKVGLAGGRSVSRLVYSLRLGECHSIKVYPLAISPVIDAIALDANSLVGVLAYRHYEYNVRGYMLQYASPLDWEEMRGNIRKHAETHRILAEARSVDIAFMGLGILDRRQARIDLLGDLLETRPGLKELNKKGAVGDILYHLVDQHGQPISKDISDLICSIQLEDLQEMIKSKVKVVVIASGRQKAKIARAAIKARYANVFIIDDELAHALLELERSN